jgi:hypothetical protein
MGTEQGHLTWHLDPPREEWDSALAQLGGHPLQSCLWGDSRRRVEAIADVRWLLKDSNKPVWMIRIERRRLPIGGWVGWSPKGPTGVLPSSGEISALLAQLRKDGMQLLVTDPWRRVREDGASDRPRTVWIDLTVGEKQVWERLHPKFRQYARGAARTGVIIDVDRSAASVDAFCALCARISHTKRFSFTTSPDLMRAILAHSGGGAEACLLTARLDKKLVAGLFVLRCGASAHLIWGGADREIPHSRGAEAVHWAAMKWAIGKGCRILDLEGIDPERNPGTYAFKKKMGGEDVTLAGREYLAMGMIGGALAFSDRWRSGRSISIR